MIEAVIVDLDGVIVDSEQVWDAARESVARERGGRWHEHAQEDMMGMSSKEWSRYMHQNLKVPDAPEEINCEVVGRMEAIYREKLPLIEGAPEAVRRLAQRWPLGLASSSNRPIIELVLGLSGLNSFFQVAVSSEEVERGKPAPDVYLEVARRLGVNPERAAAIEDSRSGILSAKAANMRVVAIPNLHFPPDEETLGVAGVVLDSIRDLTPQAIEGL